MWISGGRSGKPEIVALWGLFKAMGKDEITHTVVEKQTEW